MTSKAHVLSILEQNRGSSVSGEEIADKMQVSRAAVWKAVRELKKEGYQISAATNKGYSLSPDSDVLSVAGMLYRVRRFCVRLCGGTNRPGRGGYEDISAGLSGKIAKDAPLALEKF